MYNMSMEKAGNAYTVQFDNVVVKFDSKELAMEFIIKVLVETGRMGY